MKLLIALYFLIGLTVTATVIVARRGPFSLDPPREDIDYVIAGLLALIWPVVAIIAILGAASHWIADLARRLRR